MIRYIDNNGNVTKHIDESGNDIAAYEYDDFGRLISATGQMADFFRIRFSTKYYDLETGLYYYGYRFYSPALMRWLNRDPIEEQGGKNLYMYREKLFQFGYFVYKLSGRKGNYERISANPDMYTAWSVGGATRLLPSSDISESGDLDKCDKLQIQYGDRGYPPLTLWVVPEK